MDNALVKSQLGLSYNTARYKLNRILLFEFATRLSLLDCYRCGRKIQSIDDFSVDHKQPWLHVRPELFWDTSNIAFSHFQCNAGCHRGKCK